MVIFLGRDISGCMTFRSPKRQSLSDLVFSNYCHSPNLSKQLRPNQHRTFNVRAQSEANSKMQNELDPHQARTVIAYTLFKKNQNDLLGFIQPIAELVNGQLESLTKENFCVTERVFITSNYESLEKSYPDRKLFQIKVILSEKISDNPHDCRYVAAAADASIVRSKDYFEIISAPLPPADSRIVIPDDFPGTTYVFIRDGDFTYGPFSWTRASRDPSNTAIKIEFLDAPLPGVSLAQFQSYKIDSTKVDAEAIKAMGSKRVFVQHLGILLGAEYFDYASDDEIVRYAMKLAGDQGIKIIERSRAESLVTYIRRNPKTANEFNKKRLQRLLEITDITEQTREDVSKGVAAFLNTDAGRPIILSFINQNESIFLERLRKDNEDALAAQLADLYAEITKSEQRIADLNNQKSTLYDKVQHLQNEAKRGADMSQVYAANDELISKRRQEIAELDEQIKERQQHYKIGETVEKLKKDIEYNERRKEEAIDNRKRAEEALGEVQERLKDHSSKLQSRLIDLKPFVDAINGSFATGEAIVENVTVATKAISEDGLVAKQNAVVHAFHNAMFQHGRSMQEHEVANLLITTQQSFMTIFAGLPGTGKTSMARLIADAQNLHYRLREIPVSRGWTSQKDLIGYYNPLTSKFQAASTCMYSFLRALCSESDKERAMAYVLLDEANLSPIEHYWSAFMGITDNEGDRKLILGTETFTIPDNLRFIATINYDGTTEPLSPRLINRSPVIVLNTLHSLDVTATAQQLQEPVLPVPAYQMHELFGPCSSTPEMEDQERSTYELVRKALQDSDSSLGLPISISPRKENAISQYLDKARGLMNIDADMVALDFAIQQHILPLIQGHGQKFGKRLESLRTVLEDNELTRSQKTLERIISFGEADLHTYDFFCW